MVSSLATRWNFYTLTPSFVTQMNDGLNSLARMYSGAVSDFFAQAVISFMVWV
jgi:hypothetical protein